MPSSDIHTETANNPQANVNADWSWQTKAVRHAGVMSSQGENSDAIFLTSSFRFKDAETAKKCFADEMSGNVYSRFTNPNVDALAQRLAELENGQYGVVTSTGMSAILTLCLSLLKQGDEMVCSQDVFGTTVSFFRDLLCRFGIQVHFVDLGNLQDWKKSITPKTKLLFCETPTNPLCRIADIEALAEIAKEHDCLLAVDNCFATPALQQPLQWGADIVMHSMTKFIDGSGRCLGGALVCRDEQLYIDFLKFVRVAGPSLSPFNAWVMLKSLETLSLRMQQHSSNATKISQFLCEHNQVKRVFHPSLLSGYEQDLFNKQMTDSGAVVSFEVTDQCKAWQVIDECRLFSITANLGDARSTICHPASTTHHRLGESLRSTVGISDGLIRLSVGLECVDDLCGDLSRGLSRRLGK